METALGTTTPPAEAASSTTGTPAAASSGATGGATSLGNSGEAKSWRESLPEEIRTHAAISSFQDVPSLVKSFIHAQSIVGKKGVVVPGEKATPEEWQSFYQQIGVPALDKYEVKAPEKYPISAETVGKFKEIAAKSGLLPQQATGILEWYSQFEADTLKAHEEGVKKEAATQMEGLKKEWGDGYDKNIQSAQFAAKHVGGDEFIKYLNETGLGNDINLVKVFSKVAKLLGEDTLREGGVTSEGQSPKELNDALAELRANGDANGLYDKNHPMHAVTMGKFESLAKRLTNGR